MAIVLHQAHSGTPLASIQAHSEFMYESEKPSVKHFVIVILAAAVLIGLSWIAYYRFGLFR